MNKIFTPKFFSHPMRPFFALGLACGILGALSFFWSADFVFAHRVFFLNLLPMCAYSGFLLTALPDWTNYKGSLKGISRLFYVLLLTAFIFSFFWARGAAFAVSVFWLAWLVFAIKLLFLDRNDKNFSILLVLFLFFVSEFTYAITLDERFLNAQIHINIAAILVVSFRVSVVLGAEALKSSKLKDPVFIPNFVYKNLALTFVLAYFGANLFLPQKVAGFLALACGFTLLAKLKELHYFDLLKKHYVLVYYALELSGAIGYLWLGVCEILGFYGAGALHLIAICYMIGVVFLILMVAGLRHSGFVELNFPKLCLILFVLLGVSGVMRAVCQTWNLYVVIPAILLTMTFIFYAISFLPIFANNEFSEDPE